MNLELAMAILTEVCKMYRGTLADHERVQAALARVREIVAPAPQVEKVE